MLDDNPRRYVLHKSGAPSPLQRKEDENLTSQTSKLNSVMHKNETVNQTYRLSGIIYLLIDHYFCRVVDHKNQVWFSDGRKFAGQFELDGSLQQMSDEDLNKLGSCIAQVAIYSKNP